MLPGRSMNLPRAGTPSAAAPPVYRPSPLASRTLQPARTGAAAPPVYRPTSVGQSLQASAPRPTPPPVYRPQGPGGSIQPKATATPTPPPVYRPSSLSPVPKPAAPLTSTVVNLRQAPRVIQRNAATDLAEADLNRTYITTQVTAAMVAAQAVIVSITGEPHGITKDRAAAGVKDFMLKYIDQIDARNTELLEGHRLLQKPGAKRRIPLLSANDLLDADLTYINSTGDTITKEIKTVNSASQNTVDTHIASADKQLGKRVADKHKVFIKIANVNNPWPATPGTFNNIADHTQLKQAIRARMPDMANADYLRIDDVNIAYNGGGVVNVDMEFFGTGRPKNIRVF